MPDVWSTRHSGPPTLPSPRGGRKWNRTLADGTLRAMIQPQTESPPSVRWRARAAALAGVVAASFVWALYARQTRDVLSDWDPTFVGAQALLQGQSPYAAIQVPPWPNYLLYPLPALLLTRSVHVHSARRRARALRRHRGGGVHIRHHRARALDPLAPDQRRDAVELDRRAVASAADSRGADSQPLLVAGGEADPWPGPVERLSESQSRHRWSPLCGALLPGVAGLGARMAGVRGPEPPTSLISCGRAGF